MKNADTMDDNVLQVFFIAALCYVSFLSIELLKFSRGIILKMSNVTSLRLSRTLSFISRCHAFQNSIKEESTAF